MALASAPPHEAQDSDSCWRSWYKGWKGAGKEGGRGGREGGKGREGGGGEEIGGQEGARTRTRRSGRMETLGGLQKPDRADETCATA